MSFLTVTVCQGASIHDPLKPLSEVNNFDMEVVNAAPMQQWFANIQPQMKEWAKCEYALLDSDKFGPAVHVSVTKRLRKDVQRLLPSVAPGAKAYQLDVEYTKWFYTWRGFQQGLASGSDVCPKRLLMLGLAIACGSTVAEG